MNKIKITYAFCNSLDSMDIDYDRFTDYHIQVDRNNNFYPTTNRYYNSKTGVKKYFKEFKSKEEFDEFILINNR